MKHPSQPRRSAIAGACCLAFAALPGARAATATAAANLELAVSAEVVITVQRPVIPVALPPALLA